ncbi:MAG: hypothetical protein A4E58_03012 [Syntrophorhabdus sp. PtaB.Bin006]|nr:MAG: hypothetical protein A4E58_03012 [Syntrophorhabdus sp. PtaB.Bin006]
MKAKNVWWWKGVTVLALVCVWLAPFACPGGERTIGASIPVPEGYVRKTYPRGSFSNWVQRLPLKDEVTITDYAGRRVIVPFYNVYGVVKMPLLFRADLEQCADFSMRFWAEYHRAEEMLDRLYLFDYHGRKQFFKASGLSYREFLRRSFSGSNSYSLKVGCREVQAGQLGPGDIIVQNRKGGVGHVSMIVDVCESAKGDRLFLIGYSFMPAQEFHIEKVVAKYGFQGWFTLDGYSLYLRDFLDLGEPVLRRFVSL